MKIVGLSLAFLILLISACNDFPCYDCEQIDLKTDSVVEMEKVCDWDDAKEWQDEHTIPGYSAICIGDG